ncbi:MAG: response regulator [Gammaproteobacteria bacterium]|nr:response regulator [Gammaproteobacteria bacterium]
MAQQPSVLIVDDVEMNRQLLEKVFEERFDVVSVDSGEAALEAMRHIVPDVILLDVMMPGISGYDVCRHIRADEQLKSIKVFMVSARAMDDDQEQGIDAGADEYITKPFNAFELRDRLLVMLDAN